MSRKLTVRLLAICAVIFLGFIIYRIHVLKPEGGYVLAEIWESNTGSTKGQYCATSMAVDKDGNIIAVGYKERRIVKINPTGKMLTEWGLRGSGNKKTGPPEPVIHPVSIAIGPDGAVYVADQDNNRIQKFDSQGKYIAEWRKYYCKDEGERALDSPSSVAVDGDGNVYVSEFGSYSEIVGHSTSGEPIIEHRSRIIQFTSEGRCTKQLYLTKRPPDGINPRTIIVDANNHIDVVDTGYRILSYDRNGKLLHEWGKMGVMDGGFNDPQGLASDRHGNLYVTDSGHNNVQIFSSTGRFKSSFNAPVESLGSLAGIAVMPDGTILVSDDYNCRIYKYVPLIKAIFSRQKKALN